MGKNCGHTCKHFHGECYFDNESETLKFKEWCDKYNERYSDFNEKYGNKNAAWVDENIIMACFEPNEFTESLDNMSQKIDNLLNEID